MKRKQMRPARERLQQYLGHPVNAGTVADALIRLAMSSVARLCILPMQDVLNLGEETRMNLPSKSKGNWEWRLRNNQVTPALSKRLMDLTWIYGRLPSKNEQPS